MNKRKKERKDKKGKEEEESTYISGCLVMSTN
jgi:hypothetical protein